MAIRRLLPIAYIFLAVCVFCTDTDPWETVELGTDAVFRDIFFVDGENGWIVGDGGPHVSGGIIGRTRDGGNTWQYQSGLIPQRYNTSSIGLNAVYFSDALHGCIASESGNVLLTEDGGETWEQIRVEHSVYMHLKDVDFVDAQNGWIIGHAGVLRTEDGGTTWSRVDKEREVTGEAIEFLDLMNGWVVGKFGYVRHTEDGGVSWAEVQALGNLDGLSGDEIPTLTSLDFSDESHGWIAGYWREITDFEEYDHAVIIHTSDGGKTWVHQIDGMEARLRAIRFADSQRGWAVGYNIHDGISTVLHTEDGGETWLPQASIHGEELLSVCIRGECVWAVGDRVREEPQRLLRLVLSEDG